MVVIQSSADLCWAAVVATGARATSRTANFILTGGLVSFRLAELVGRKDLPILDFGEAQAEKLLDSDESSAWEFRDLYPPRTLAEPKPNFNPAS